MAKGKKTDPKAIRAWVDKIVPILQRGTDIKNACAFLKIPYTTFWDQLQKDESLRIEIAAAQNHLDILAETKIADSIHKGNTPDAKWVLERSQRNKYGPRQEITGPGGKPLGIATPLELLPKEKRDEMEDKPVDDSTSGDSTGKV